MLISRVRFRVLKTRDEASRALREDRRRMRGRGENSSGVALIVDNEAVSASATNAVMDAV
jgi:hypothetical protein